MQMAANSFGVRYAGDELAASVVVVLLPILDDHPCFEETVEFVHVQTFVTDTVVERGNSFGVVGFR